MNVIVGYAVAALFWLAALCVLAVPLRSRRNQRAVVRLAGFKWTRADFCRGWLITGDTGSGKTRSGITPLLFQIFTNEPTWGGLCIDDKGCIGNAVGNGAAFRPRGRSHPAADSAG